MSEGMRMDLHPDDYRLLSEYVSKGKDYVEIGTHAGASSIVAARACTGEIHCIDPFGPYKSNINPVPSGEMARRNWELAELDLSRLHIHAQAHPPWPESIKDRMFDVGLIDGCHELDQVWLDWESMSQHVRKYILFHDVKADRKYEQGAEVGPTEILYKVIELPEWDLCEIRGYMAVVRRKHD